MTWPIQRTWARTILKLLMGNISRPSIANVSCCGLPPRSNLKGDFTLRDIPSLYPERRPTVADLLEPVVDAKFILTPVLWKYLYRYAKKHQAKGNGFGFGMVNPNDPHSVTRTLSARYYKDGAEILIDRGWDKALGEKISTIRTTSVIAHGA